MNVRQIDAYRAVMMEGTVTGAARRLRVSQPAVSRLLAQLEKSVGFLLFRREKQRLVPTREGIMLFKDIELTYRGLDKVARTADQIRRNAVGALNVISLPALASGFLPRVVGRFRAQLPSIPINLQTRSSMTVVDWMNSGQFDLGISGPGPKFDGLDSVVFYNAPGVVVVPRRHKLARKRVVALADLAGAEFVSLDHTDPTRIKIDALFHKHGVSRSSLVETPYAATVCAMVALGLGVSIINPFTAYDCANLDIAIRPLHPAPLFETRLLTPTSPPPSRVARAFITLLTEERDRVLAAAPRPR
jgi:DNA-binding transcriptional LysR family regulator